MAPYFDRPYLRPATPDLDPKERAAVADALKAIEISGLRAAGVRTRQVKGKLWEIKASQQRVFYVVVMGGEMVLLHAAKKEGQKLTRGTWRPPNCGSERSRGRGPEGPTEATLAKKKNPHIGRSLDEFIEEQRAKDPEFRAEFDRLQLARKVKGLREKKKMSQVELAALAGTKQPNIARLESGKVVPRLDFLEKVARALGGHLDVRIVEGKRNA